MLSLGAFAVMLFTLIGCVWYACRQDGEIT